MDANDELSVSLLSNWRPFECCQGGSQRAFTRVRFGAEHYQEIRHGRLPTAADMRRPPARPHAGSMTKPPPW